jgi:transcriptional regulator with XRE-family HTH domain
MPTTIERTVDVEHRVEVLAHEAQVRRAQERLLRIEDMRAARQLKQSGMTQREIADVLRTTQPRVGRLLRGASALGDTPSPEEVILLATVRGIPRDKLLRQLRGLDYTFTQFAPYPHEGSVPGTWTQVSTAHQLGLLSDEEYESVSSAVHPPTAQ